MRADLTIILKNQAPNREERYPRTWLIYPSSRDAVKVHVTHSGVGSPRVVDKKAV